MSALAVDAGPLLQTMTAWTRTYPIVASAASPMSVAGDPRATRGLLRNVPERFLYDISARSERILDVAGFAVAMAAGLAVEGIRPFMGGGFSPRAMIECVADDIDPILNRESIGERDIQFDLGPVAVWVDIPGGVISQWRDLLDAVELYQRDFPDYRESMRNPS